MDGAFIFAVQTAGFLQVRSDDGKEFVDPGLLPEKDRLWRFPAG